MKATIKWRNAQNKKPTRAGDYITIGRSEEGKTVKGWDYFSLEIGWCSRFVEGLEVLWWAKFDELPDPPTEN